MKLKINDVLYSTWGYDDCLVNFYLVVGSTPKRVKIREIKSCKTSGNWDDGYAVPILEDPQLGPVETRSYSEYNGTVYVKTDHGCARPWDGKPVHTYNHH